MVLTAGGRPNRVGCSAYVHSWSDQHRIINIQIHICNKWINTLELIFIVQLDCFNEFVLWIRGNNNDLLIGLIVFNPFTVADVPYERQAALMSDGREHSLSAYPCVAFFAEAVWRERNPCTVRSCLRQQRDAPSARIKEAKIAAACCFRSLIRSRVRVRAHVTRRRGSVIESR